MSLSEGLLGALMPTVQFLGNAEDLISSGPGQTWNCDPIRLRRGGCMTDWIVKVSHSSKNQNYVSTCFHALDIRLQSKYKSVGGTGTAFDYVGMSNL